MDCNGNIYNIGMGCCEPVLGPIENYYTKPATDRKIEEAISGISAVTIDEVQEMIDESISGITVSGVTEEQMNEAIASAKTEIEGEIPSLDGYATEQWVEDKHYITGVDLSDYALKSEIPVVPTSNTAFTNDAGYLTEHQSLSGYATEAFVSGFTYDKATIDEKVAGGGSFDPSQYYNKTATDELLAEKLDATAYTPTDLSNYYTKSEVDNEIISAITDVEAEIPVVPTSNTAFTNDAGYITGVDLSNYATTGDVQTAVSVKQDTLVSSVNIKTINNQSLLGSGNIDIQGGTGGTSCTVDEKEVLENYNEIKYGNYQSKVYYTYSGTPTDNQYSYSFNIYNGSSNTYVNGSVNFGTGGHTGNTSGWDTYYSVTWDNTKKRYLFATNAGYYINSFNRSNGYVYLQVPIGTVSGTPCEAASTLTDAVNEALVRAQDAVNNIFLIGDAGSRKLSFSREHNNGNSFSQDITLTDLKFTGYNVLETDINVGLGTSGWTNINTSACSANDLKITKFKAVYGNGIEAYPQKNMWVYYAFSYSGGNMRSSFYLSFSNDTTISVELPTTGWSAVYDSATSALTVTAPEGNVEYQGNTGVFSIVEIYNNDCKFGNGITLQQYAENTEPIRQYVQENRTAINSKASVWCGSEADWALISGGTLDSNTIYLVY